MHSWPDLFIPSKPSGYFLNPLTLETFVIHFKTTRIDADPILCKSQQVGALALTAAAVGVPLPVSPSSHLCPRSRERLNAGELAKKRS